MYQNGHKGRTYAFTPKVNTVTFIFFMSSCFCIFLLISRAQEESYLAIQSEAIRNVAKDPRYAELYRKSSGNNKNLKYVLLWTREDFHPFYTMVEGQSAFLKYGCPEVNCYVTSNRKLFQDDITKFDSVVFNGRNIHSLNKRYLPKIRSPQQRYIFICLESAHNYPVCKTDYDNFFNWTASYRLDSDILFPYISIKNAAGEYVGPNNNIEWMNRTSLTTATSELYLPKVIKKTKAAAWFVSNCKDKSDRMNFAKKLQKSLSIYDLQLDIYGRCGTLECPKDNPKCTILLENDYYFYLSLENSLSEDYVTEKVLTALDHFTIPVVYGGANYSRFLPPHSYIDGNTMSPPDIAALMHRLIQSPKLYLEYMWWREHYSFHYALEEATCNICSALHNETMLQKQSVYSDFREWWYPKYKNECKSV